MHFAYGLFSNFAHQIWDNHDVLSIDSAREMLYSFYERVKLRLCTVRLRRGDIIVAFTKNQINQQPFEELKPRIGAGRHFRAAVKACGSITGWGGPQMSGQSFAQTHDTDGRMPEGSIKRRTDAFIHRQQLPRSGNTGNHNKMEVVMGS